MKPDGGAAFPLQTTVASGQGGTITMDAPHMKMQRGMTLRDYFAAKAIGGMLADPGIRDMDAFIANGPKQAYAVADAMLAERDK